MVIMVKCGSCFHLITSNDGELRKTQHTNAHTVENYSNIMQTPELTKRFVFPHQKFPFFVVVDTIKIELQNIRNILMRFHIMFLLLYLSNWMNRLAQNETQIASFIYRFYYLEQNVNRSKFFNCNSTNFHIHKKQNLISSAVAKSLTQ